MGWEHREPKSEMRDAEPRSQRYFQEHDNRVSAI
jgi:hypothetical protein